MFYSCSKLETIIFPSNEKAINIENFYLLPDGVNGKKIKLIFEEKEDNLYKIILNNYIDSFTPLMMVTYEDKNITINLLDYFIRPYYNE